MGIGMNRQRSLTLTVFTYALATARRLKRCIRIHLTSTSTASFKIGGLCFAHNRNSVFPTNVLNGS